MGLRVELTLPGTECGLRSAISATVQVVDGVWVMGPVQLNGAQVEKYPGERPELRTLLEAELSRFTGGRRTLSSRTHATRSGSAPMRVRWSEALSRGTWIRS